MRRKLFFLFICIMAMLSFAGCKSKEEDIRRERKAITEEKRPSIPKIDWDEKIYEETIFEETPIDKAIADAVKIKVKKATEEVVIVKITAPDVGAQIIEWYTALPEAQFSEELMEDEIVRLIGDGKPMESEIELPYVYDSAGNVIIDYTNAYYDKIYCGVAEFFDYVTNLLYDEVMEVEGDEAYN